MDQIHYGLKGIKLTEYFVDESIELDEESDVNYNASIRSITDQEEIHFTITANYKKKKSGQEFLRGSAVTVFMIKEMRKYTQLVNGSEVINFPDPFLVALFGISFTHARALFASSAGATKFAAMLLPLINPEIVFKQIFAQHLDGFR